MKTVIAIWAAAAVATCAFWGCVGLVIFHFVHKFW